VCTVSINSVRSTKQVCKHTSWLNSLTPLPQLQPESSCGGRVTLHTVELHIKLALHIKLVLHIKLALREEPSSGVLGNKFWPAALERWHRLRRCHPCLWCWCASPCA
jgi:hypothetical protein